MSAPTYLLRLDTIPGESVSAAGPHEIDVLSVDWAAQSLPSARHGRGGAARPEPGAVTVVAASGISSPLLMKALASGQLIATATLRAVARGDGRRVWFSIDLTDVLVVGYELVGAPEETPVDKVLLAFGTMTMTFWPADPGAGAGTPVASTWDVRSHRVH